MLDIALLLFALTVLCLAITPPGTPARAAIWRMIAGTLVAGAVVMYAA
jgi:hypothetical protein